MNTKVLPVQHSLGIYASRRSASYLKEAIEGDSRLVHLTPYNIAAACASMEGALNNCFVDFLHQKIGNSYQKHIKPYLFMKVQDRLALAPMMLSDYKFELPKERSCQRDSSTIRLA